MSTQISVALVSGVVSISVAAITAFATVFPKINEASASAKKADESAAKAERAAERAAEEAKEIIRADPGALAVHYYATSSAAYSELTRFDFGTKTYDPQNGVKTGHDWRYTAKIPGIYYVGVDYVVPNKKITQDSPPYVKCAIKHLRNGAATAEDITKSESLDVSCFAGGIFKLGKGDQLYSEFRREGWGGDVTGNFYAVFIGREPSNSH